MTQVNAHISDFDGLAKTVERIPLNYQKELAEEILSRLEEKGYVCYWHGDLTGLTAVKTEHL